MSLARCVGNLRAVAAGPGEAALVQTACGEPDADAVVHQHLQTGRPFVGEDGRSQRPPARDRSPECGVAPLRRPRSYPYDSRMSAPVKRYWTRSSRQFDDCSMTSHSGAGATRLHELSVIALRSLIAAREHVQDHRRAYGCGGLQGLCATGRRCHGRPHPAGHGRSRAANSSCAAVDGSASLASQAFRSRWSRSCRRLCWSPCRARACRRG